MADEIDAAQDAERQRLNILLANRTHKTLPFTGMCHNCMETLSEGQFCDADCRDDYEKRRKFQR